LYAVTNLLGAGHGSTGVTVGVGVGGPPPVAGGVGVTIGALNTSGIHADPGIGVPPLTFVAQFASCTVGVMVLVAVGSGVTVGVTGSVGCTVGVTVLVAVGRGVIVAVGTGVGSQISVSSLLEKT